MTTLFLDLDGPILDTAERNYRVYRAIVDQFGGRLAHNLHSFWDEKRRGVSSFDLFTRESGSANLDADGFARMWLEQIEAPNWLAFDRLQSGVVQWLVGVAAEFDLILVTLRQNRDGLHRQLEQLRLARFFRAVLVDSPTIAAGWTTKHRLITSSGLPLDGVQIGDTEVDIRCGKLLGLGTIAVCCGIRDRNTLAPEQPDLLVDSLVELEINQISATAKKYRQVV